MSDLIRTLRETAHYPPHPPRHATKLFTKNHKAMCVTEDQPCHICGVTRSTLKHPEKNRYGAIQMESHHFYVEDSLANAVDPVKFNSRLRVGLHKRYPDEPLYQQDMTADQITEWVHGHRHNLMTLCLTGEMPVLMADGTECPIKMVRPTDMVIGPDGNAHMVTGSMARYTQEPIYVIDGVEMTGNHPVLTPQGWARADALAVGQIVYKLRVVDPQMIRLRRTQDQVIQPVIGLDAVTVMDPLPSSKPAVQMALHDVIMEHHAYQPAITPDLTPDVATGRMRREEPRSPDTWLPVQDNHTTGVGAEHRFAAEYHAEGRPAFPTATCFPASPAPLAQESATRSATGVIPVDQGGDRLEGGLADDALLDHTERAGFFEAGWGPIDHLAVRPFIGCVYDITVPDCSSFIAGGIAVHNCDVHHRHPLVGIHEVTYPIHSVADLIMDDWDLTGYVAHSPSEAKALNALPMTTGTALPPPVVPTP